MATEVARSWPRETILGVCRFRNTTGEEGRCVDDT